MISHSGRLSILSGLSNGILSITALPNPWNLQLSAPADACGCPTLPAAGGHGACQRYPGKFPPVYPAQAASSSLSGGGKPAKGLNSSPSRQQGAAELIPHLQERVRPPRRTAPAALSPRSAAGRSVFCSGREIPHLTAGMPPSPSEEKATWQNRVRPAG